MHYILRLSILAIGISLIFSEHLLAAAQQPTSFQEQLAKLEASADGRIGLSAVNTANNMRLQYHAEERFPMGCTSKALGVAAILKQSMADSRLLSQKIQYTKADLQVWSPVTKNHLDDGMTISQLCAAAIIQSDNTAMNLLVKKLGGLQTINNFARSIGNKTARLDRMWPDEARAVPGDVRDTATPAAMEQSLQRIALGNVLGQLQREQLQVWLKSSITGYEKIRAGVPHGWVVGDKTGSGFYYGINNDIGIIWPPKYAPIVVAIYFIANKKDATKRPEVIAAATRILLNEFAQTDQCIRIRYNK